ncbi:Chemotaxis sensory transducer [Candidatus Terasakiella magnetica]|nr:Chemotaxis sensory transducer [Candidatus Terasakiella magnetica]
MSTKGHLTGIETFFDKDEVIVTKTCLKGSITYANRTFLRISEYDENEIIGRQHNLIRHPDMPRCVFKLLWARLQAQHEIFAYVVNRSKLGNHYWVLAHVTPSLNSERKVVGFHSSRRVPERAPLEGTIIPLYHDLRQREQQEADPKRGVEASSDMLQAIIQNKGVSYDQFIFSL